MQKREQRIIRALLVIISGVLIALALSGKAPADRDVTAELITFPLGFYMIFSKSGSTTHDLTNKDVELRENILDAEWVPMNQDKKKAK